jgi:hypothetical protein
LRYPEIKPSERARGRPNWQRRTDLLWYSRLRNSVKRIIWLFAFTPLLASVLLGDWKIVTTTGNGSVTEFFKGELVRSDSSPEYSTVIDYDHRRQVTWRNDLRQYAVVEWPPASRSDLPPAKVISIERHTSDTGQRKQFFGRAAHRLVTRVTRNDGPETTIDG